MALLAASEWAEVRFIHGIRRGLVGKRPRTSARLGKAEHAAFERDVAALQEIVARSGASLLPSDIPIPATRRHSGSRTRIENTQIR